MTSQIDAQLCAALQRVAELEAANRARSAQARKNASGPRVREADLLDLDGFLHLRLQERPGITRSRLVADAAHSFSRSVPTIERWLARADSLELLSPHVRRKVCTKSSQKIVLSKAALRPVVSVTARRLAF